MYTLVFSLSLLIFAEATINICIPQNSEPVSVTNDVLKDIKNVILKDNPIHEDHIELDLHHPAMDLKGYFDDVDVYYPTDTKLCLFENFFFNDSVNEWQFDLFNLTLGDLKMNGVYNFSEGDIGDLFDLYGAGDFSLELLKFSIAVVNVSLNGTEELCFPIDVEIYLEDVKCNFENFMRENQSPEDDDIVDLFNRVIMGILPESLSIVFGEYKDIYDKPIEDAINDFFHNKNVASLFTKLLTSKKDPYDGGLCF